MGEDFPAAHSMDTEWFAVDRDGQVALFFTGENGSMPKGAPAANMGEVLRALGGSAAAIEALDYTFADAILEFDRLGIHVYEDASDWFSGPYVRALRPDRPLHVDQLPPQLRKQVKAVCFDGLRFADKDAIQPCDHTECEAWPSGYLAEDRQTARPVPGQEAAFRAAMERMRQEHPEEYQKYCVEGLGEGR
jgi:hypothetical protein